MNSDTVTFDDNQSASASRHRVHLNVEQAQNAPSWVTKFPSLLRGLGAFSVLLALYTFLFRGWEGNSDLIRYFMLMAHTGFLAVAALASGHFFREGKGPRLLLMLALVSVPVNFAILSAFLFAAISDTSAYLYPTFVTWSVDGLGTAITAAVVSLAVLIPVITIGFRTLARGMSKSMTILFLLGNLALLIPLRLPELVAALTISLSVFTVVVAAKTARQRTEVKTQEGKTALVLQFFPIAILLGRNIWLYPTSAVVIGALSITVFILLRHLTLSCARDSGWRTVFDLFSVVASLVAGIACAATLVDAGFTILFDMVVAPTITALMLYELSSRAQQGAGFYRILAVAVMVLSGWSNLATFDSFSASIATLLVGGAMLGLSYHSQKISVFIGGAILVVSALINQLLHFYQWFDFNYWILLAMAGVAAIVIASLIESKGLSLKNSLNKYQEKYSAWKL